MRCGFADDHACGFHHTNELAIGDAIRSRLELLGGLAERFVQMAPRLWLDFISRFLDELLRFGEIALRISGEQLQAPCDFLGLRAIGVLLLFPVALHFAEAQFEVAENFFARSAHQRFKAKFGKFMKLLDIVFANALDSREGVTDGLVEMGGQRVLDNFFGGRLQLALHGGDQLVNGDGHALRFGGRHLLRGLRAGRGRKRRRKRGLLRVCPIVSASGRRGS